MDAAEIDVGSGIFECGQTYVALSRVKSLDGLYLTSFDAQKIRINKKVKDFYESLTLYHDSKASNEEVYVPFVVVDPVNVALTIEQNKGVDCKYINTEPELTEETYDDVEPSKNPQIKCIKLLP